MSRIEFDMRKNVLRLGLLAPLALGACDATEALLNEPAPGTGL